MVASYISRFLKVLVAGQALKKDYWRKLSILEIFKQNEMAICSGMCTSVERDDLNFSFAATVGFKNFA